MVNKGQEKQIVFILMAIIVVIIIYKGLQNTTFFRYDFECLEDLAIKQCRLLDLSYVNYSVSEIGLDLLCEDPAGVLEDKAIFMPENVAMKCKVFN